MGFAIPPDEEDLLVLKTIHRHLNETDFTFESWRMNEHLGEYHIVIPREAVLDHLKALKANQFINQSYKQNETHPN